MSHSLPRSTQPLSLKTFLQYLGLVLLALLAIGPFLWLLSTALKSGDENIFAYPPQWIPEHPTVENFQGVWNAVPIGLYMLNSFAVAALTVVLNLILSALAAYPLARMNFKGKKVILILILSTMMVPFQVMMIPLFQLMLQLNLSESSGLIPLYLALSLPFAISGFGIFFLRQAMLSIPLALEEAAVLDGCNRLQVLIRVVLPMIRPALATLAIFTFIASWGEFLWPSLLLNDPEHLTLPVGLVQLQGMFSANWRFIAAGTCLSMVPIIVVFLSLQRFFLAGQDAGAVKG